MKNKLLRDMFLGFIKIHILYHADKEEIYGVDFKKELKRHGYEISYGTLYPIFHKLCENGLLQVESRNINGKIRKYYSITKKGEKVLHEARNKAKELAEEILE
ncbi:MAG: PadR family transcriptional regulator [bacterium]